MKARLSARARIVKRTLDLLLVFAGLALVLPILLVVAIAVRIMLGGPIFFRQQRPGLKGQPFELIKFRTMTDKRDHRSKLSPDAERMTTLGRFLRRASLDELPSLWNVLRGEMSLVGPRPLLMHYLDRYTETQVRRHQVLPGITGWAQVNGRNAISWDEKLALDVWYVDNWTLVLDLKILAMTVATVVGGSGIGHEGVATMPEFIGTRASAESDGKETSHLRR